MTLNPLLMFSCTSSVLPCHGKVSKLLPRSRYTIVSWKRRWQPPRILCHGFPNEFGIFLNYTQALRFDDKPDYSYLRKLFHDIFVREGYQYDYVFDWSVQRGARDDGTQASTSKVGVPRRKIVQEEEDHRASDHIYVSFYFLYKKLRRSCIVFRVPGPSDCNSDEPQVGCYCSHIVRSNSGASGYVSSL